MADIKDLQTKPVMEIKNPNMVKRKPIRLGEIAETDSEKARRKAALEGIDATNAEVLENGSKLITPDMIPTTVDPDAPDTTSMQEKEMSKLHDIITIKQQEAREEIQALMAESEVNEKIAQEKNITFDDNGNAIGEDGAQVDELSEEEELEAAFDMELAQESMGIPIGIPGAPIADPNHVYDDVSDEEFDALMTEDDRINGNFNDEEDDQNEVAEEEIPEEDTELGETDHPVEYDDDTVAELVGYPVEEGSFDDEPSVIEPEYINEELVPDEDAEMIEEESNVVDFVSKKDDDKSIEEELADAGVLDDGSEGTDANAEEEEKERQEFLHDVKKAFNFAPERILDIDDFKDAPAVSATSVLSSLTGGKASAASDWALSASKMPFTLRKFTGVELKDMSDASNGRRNVVNTLYERMKIIYDHDMNPNKPDTVEGWAKTIAAVDMNDIYFTVYDAAFHNANHIPCMCEECGHSFISDHIPTSSMVKYPDKEYEAEFKNIRNSTPRKGQKFIAKSKLVPITDHIAVSVKPADIYDYGFVIRLIGQDFYNKYRSTVDVLANIEDFYYIDAVNKTKQKISTKLKKSVQGDAIKEIKNRIVIYNRIISQLSSDEYNLLIGYASQASTLESGKRVSYEIPEIICPKCGKPLAARPLDDANSMEALLFERRPLPLITIM